MTDRELLKLAARAAGLTITGWTKQGGEEVAVLSTGGYWQPLLKNGITDCDGDSLRLAVNLGMRVYVYPGHGDDFTTVATDSAKTKQWSAREDHGSDSLAATRRAIVSVAAEVGKAMP